MTMPVTSRGLSLPDLEEATTLLVNSDGDALGALEVGADGKLNGTEVLSGSWTLSSQEATSQS